MTYLEQHQPALVVEILDLCACCGEAHIGSCPPDPHPCDHCGHSYGYHAVDCPDRDA
jgi:hypothetical protein